MLYPYMNSVTGYSGTVDLFGGLNRNVRISENEFSDMKNMSSDDYPLLATRRHRAKVNTFKYYVPTSFLCKDAFVFTGYRLFSSDSGTQARVDKVFVNDSGELTGYTLNGEGERTLVGMGAYVVVFPDKYYINLSDQSDRGYLEQLTSIAPTASSPLTITPCTLSGTEYDMSNVGKTEPTQKESGTVWVDTSEEVTAFKVWDAATKQWVQQASVYLKLSRPNIGKGFSKWDGVSISGLTGGSTSRVKEQVKALNADGVILFDVEDDYIVIAGIVDKVITMESGTVKVERKVPDMDFVCERNNRLWGCKYGVVGDKVVNEIYACKQGDFKNWNCFLGVSTDSFAASVGSDGPFTGAAAYGDNVLFFKQDCIHKLYGTIPSNFQLIKETCRGVARGNEKSIAIVNNILFYRSPVDFCAYTGALPQSISQNLHRSKYEKVIAGGVGDKVYFACTAADESRELLVYDSSLGLWHKEDDKDIIYFSCDGHVLYYVARESVNNTTKYIVESVNDDYNLLFKSETSETYPEFESDFDWYCESGDIGFEHDEHKYLQKVIIRAKKSSSAFMKFYISYDGGAFITVNSQTDASLKTEICPITPRRCEYFRLRIEGRGDAEIISISKVFAKGSDKK